MRSFIVLFNLLHSLSDESSGGRWLQVQSGDCCLPCQTDKEMAIDGSFYVDSVSSLNYVYCDIV